MTWIEDQARRYGGTIDDWRYCPYHPEATLEEYRRPHDWRKPNPGMLLDLMRVWETDPSRAVMVGDQDTDRRAAEAAGVAFHLLPGHPSTGPAPREVNLLSFLRPILDNMA
jgi:D-glycero-D-manno-heptose 1,7-bisphosphate phosphatase